MKFADLEGIPVYIIEKSIPKDKKYICVQSLINGDTGIVKKTKLKNITSKYPEKKMEELKSKESIKTVI